MAHGVSRHEEIEKDLESQRQEKEDICLEACVSTELLRSCNQHLRVYAFALNSM